MGGVIMVRGFRNGLVIFKDEFGLWFGGDGIFIVFIELSYGVLKVVKMRLVWFFDFGFLIFKILIRGSFFYNVFVMIVNFKDYGVIGVGFERVIWRVFIGL